MHLKVNRGKLQAGWECIFIEKQENQIKSIVYKEDYIANYTKAKLKWNAWWKWKHHLQETIAKRIK